MKRPAGTENRSRTIWNNNFSAIDTFAGNANYSVITNQYSTVLAAINAFKSTKTFPFTIYKTSTHAYTDLPSVVTNTCEWSALCMGSPDHITVILTIFTGATGYDQTVWEENIYNGSVYASWKQLAMEDHFHKGNLAGNSSVAITITRPCFVSVGRASTSPTTTTALVEGWGIVYLSNNSTNFSLSVTDNTLTITNGTGGYCSYIVIS